MVLYPNESLYVNIEKQEEEKNYDSYIPGLTEESHQKQLQKAREQGFEIVEGKPDKLLIDLDSWEDKLKFDSMFNMFSKHYNIEGIKRWPSKSGKGEHVVIKTANRFNSLERIALQAILGSDIKREMFNFVKAEKFGVREPSVLFKPPASSEQK